MYRAILHGIGAAEDPDVTDNYNKARAFPIAYSADDDPEVVDEMNIAAAELKEGNENDEDPQEISSDESSEESDTDEWEDNEDSREGQVKTKKFSCVDKVRCVTILLRTKLTVVLHLIASCCCRRYPSV
jgi:hypothetical protein